MMPEDTTEKNSLCTKYMLNSVCCFQNKVHHGLIKENDITNIHKNMNSVKQPLERISRT